MRGNTKNKYVSQAAELSNIRLRVCDLSEQITDLNCFFVHRSSVSSNMDDSDTFELTHSLVVVCFAMNVQLVPLLDFALPHCIIFAWPLNGHTRSVIEKMSLGAGLCQLPSSVCVIPDLFLLI